MTTLSVLERRRCIAICFNRCNGSKLRFKADVGVEGFKQFGFSVLALITFLRLAMLLFDFWTSLNLTRVPLRALVPNEPNMNELGSI